AHWINDGLEVAERRQLARTRKRQSRIAEGHTAVQWVLSDVGHYDLNVVLIDVDPLPRGCPCSCDEVIRRNRSPHTPRTNDLDRQRGAGCGCCSYFAYDLRAVDEGAL